MVEESEGNRGDGGVDEGESNTDWWEIGGRRSTALFSHEWKTIWLVLWSDCAAHTGHVVEAFQPGNFHDYQQVIGQQGGNKTLADID